MESFTHQWEKLKKNGLSDDMIENKLQNTSEKLNLLQYEFQVSHIAKINVFCL